MSSQRVKSIAVIQLDRLSSLLASMPAMLGIGNVHADAEVTYFLSTEFSSITLILGLQNVVFVEKNSANIETILGNYTAEFDKIINFSKCAEGLVLASGLYAKKRVGLYLDGENGLIESSDPWCTYLEGVVGKTNFNPFHLSDIYARVADLNKTNIEYRFVAPGRNAEINPAVTEFSNSGGAKIAISVSALPEKTVSLLVEQLLGRFSNLTIALVGTLRSRPNALLAIESNQNHKNRLFNLTGQTTLLDLAQVALAADIVIAKPGPLVQLASGYGTLTFSINTPLSSATESAPYGHGHLVIQAQGGASALSVSTGISNIIEFVIGSNRSSAPESEEWQAFFETMIESHMQDLRVFLCQRVGHVGADGKEQIELILLPLLFNGYSYEDIVRSFYRLLWCLELENRGDVVEQMNVLEVDALTNIRALLRPLEQLGELAAFGIRYTNLIRTALTKNDLQSAKVSSASLQEVDDTIASLCATCPEIVPLRNFFALQQQHVMDTNPIAGANAMELCYRDLQNRILILLELINSLFQQESAQLKELTNG